MCSDEQTDRMPEMGTTDVTWTVFLCTVAECAGSHVPLVAHCTSNAVYLCNGNVDSCIVCGVRQRTILEKERDTHTQTHIHTETPTRPERKYESKRVYHCLCYAPRLCQRRAAAINTVGRASKVQVCCSRDVESQRGSSASIVGQVHALCDVVTS